MGGDVEELLTCTRRHTRIRCEGVRPDVQHLDQSMMTYPWFRIKQARHFNNITFPNKIYNPYKEEGYSMEQFLRANARDGRRPAFLCGGWYHDEKPAHAGGGTPGHTTHPLYHATQVGIVTVGRVAGFVTV